MPPPPAGGDGRTPLPASAFAPQPEGDDDLAGCAASAGGAAATLTPATAAGRRASMDAAAHPRGVDNASRATLAGEASGDGGRPPSPDDVEVGPAAATAALNDQLMEPVPLSSRIKLEFTELSTWVPRLFGPGAPGGALTRSATLLKTASTRAFGSVASKRGSGLASSSKGGPPSGGSGTQPMRQVLYSISGCCNPGEVLALMGPSGSGKTTLLSILGGRTPKGATVTGGVLFNGAPMTKRAKRSLGFVLQDDLLYEALTVQETLYYAAMLRLPRTMSSAQKKERVTEVIAALGLTKCRDTIIGGFFRRGISGGERKRVSVGHELLINPSVLLLDEPTSGLDSTTAMRLVTTLRSLAAGGRAVATTIHQPSSRLFQLLDKLLLLSEGHAIYYGRAALATDWFHRLGFTMPYGVNAADFLLDVASGDVSGATDGGGGAPPAGPAPKSLSGEPARRHLIDVYERFASLHGTEHDGFSQSVSLSAAVVGPDAWAAMQARRSLSDTLPADVFAAGGGGDRPPSAGGSSSKALPPSAHAGALPPTDGPVAVGPAAANGKGGGGLASLSSAAIPKADRWGASYGTQLSILFARAVKTRRFEAMSGQDFAQFIVVGLLSGLFWWQIGRDRTVAAAANINGLLFFEMLFLSFRSMFAALFTFPNEHKMMLKERASGMYRLSAFYFARTASDVPMEVTIPTVFIVIIYFMAGLRLSAWAFLSNWAAVTLCLLVAQSFGLLIGATVMVPKTAQTITAIIMLTMMLVGGFYVTTIPAWIAWLKYASFVYYGYNLLLKINWVGVPLWDCAGANPPRPQSNPACTLVPPGGLQAKLHLQENTERWPWEALALLAWLVVFRAAVYVALRRKTGARAR